MTALARKLPTLVALLGVCLFAAFSTAVVFAVVPEAALVPTVGTTLSVLPPAANESDAPTVWFDYTSPTTASTANVTIHWCDDVSLVSNTRYFTVNGGVVSVGYNTGSYSGCAAYASATVNVSLALGSNTLYSKIRGDNFEWGEASGEIVREAPPPPTFGVSVTPDGSVVTKSATTAATQVFTISNTGNTTTTFQLTAACAGPGTTAGACSISPNSISVAGGSSSSATVSFTSGAAGTTGRIDVTADSGGVLDEGYVTVNVIPTAPAVNYPVVDVSNTHPGTTVERGACLSISLGANAAAECGDLRIVHALPTITTLNKARTPTLLYNSYHNRPYAVIAADVAVPAGSSGVPDSVKVRLKIDGSSTVIDSGAWSGAAWSVGGPSRRVGVGYNAAGTGTTRHKYRLEVTFKYGGNSNMTPVEGQYVVVDRRNSAFGAGWWLAGLEQLVIATDTILWVGGDGSSRVYTRPNAGSQPNSWVAPAFTRPDSMFRDAGNGEYTRKLPNGVKVVFNATGQHTRTVNRLGHTTTFGYTSGRLTTITVPPSSANAVYNFGYSIVSDGTQRLTSVSVRGPTGGSTRTTTVDDSAGVIRSILDPGDSVAVRFFYVSASNTHIRARRDRMHHTTIFAYDAWNRVAHVTDSVGSVLLRDSLTIAETRGQPTGGATIRSDSVVTLHNGPRPAADAVDITRFAVNRFGAPVRITNALGYVTKVDFGDSRFPGLATCVVAPNGRAIVALHDRRGNLISSTDSATLAGGKYSITRYQWDATWDAVTKVTSPMGVITEMAYVAANGNRAWQQDGRGSMSRVSFRYDTSGVSAGLLRATAIPGPYSDSVAYDQRFGNVSLLVTTKGYRSLVARDSIGRVTITRRQIDTATTVTTLAHADSSLYDLRDLVQRTISTGPAMSGIDSQKVIVEYAYDGERRPTLVRRQASPDPLSIGWVSTTWAYDVAGRRVRETDGAGNFDSTSYDAAGLVIGARDRRGIWTRMKYDAVGNLIQRIADAVTYDSAKVGVATLPCPPTAQPCANLLNFRHASPYPMFLKNASGGLTIPADTATFTYDSLGLRLAVGRDAKVKRSYDATGALETDSLFIAFYARNDWHAYGLRHTYDRDGRRTMLRHPNQLAPTIGGVTADSALFAYDAATGYLARVIDPLGSVFEFTFDARSQVTLATSPGGISQSYEYDTDGQLWKNRVHNSSTVTNSHPDTLLRSVTMAYDARGKLLRSKNTLGIRDSMEFSYSGIGHLRTSAFRDSASAYMSGRVAVSAQSQESFVNDALGNLVSSTLQYAGLDGVGVPPTANIQSYAYFGDGTGRLRQRVDSSRLYDSLTYDAAGNQRFESWFTEGSRGADDRMSYYDGLGRLYAVDRRQSGFYASSPLTVPQMMTFEEYRYDPLGRRVLVRSRRWCNDDAKTTYLVDCFVNVMRRTVWDGAQELWEIQVPGDEAASASVLDNDIDTVAAQPSPGNGSGWDQNPMWGRVGYTFGLALDQPLSLVRVGYRMRELSSVSLKTWAPFVVVPQWNARGMAENGSFADGAYKKCEVDAGVTRCVEVPWPHGWFSMGRRSYVPKAWHGTLIEGKRDQSSLLYRRNRMVDPNTGRFTQQDPIGIAGGLNLYGYANGDPINLSDPFGLAVCFTGSAEDVQKLKAGSEDATNSTITLDKNNCVSKVEAKEGDGFAEIQERFNSLVADGDVFTVRYGVTGQGFYSHFDPKTKSAIILRGDVGGFRYRTGNWLSCNLIGGHSSAPMTLGGLVAHELIGHGRGAGERNSRRIENQYHTARGQSARCLGD